jgi:hypothetical protein
MPIQTVSQAFSNEGVGGFSFRNKIINGAMEIDQRNSGSAVTISDQYTLDRWSAYENTDGTFTVQRSTTAPTGFSNSLLATITSADSSLTTNQQTIPCRQWIEAANMTDLAWGTSSAKSITLSFWVRGSVTGTYGITISNNANDVVYAATYTISAANTFEYKTITIPGPTSGTWPTDNGRGMIVTWSLGAGSSVTVSSNNSWISSPGAAIYAAVGQTNVKATNGATWFITGVQLEVGSASTPFERRSYGAELQLCQRYFETAFPVGTAISAGATYFWYTNVTSYSSTISRSQWIDFKATKRALPTVTPYRTSIAASNDNSWSAYTPNGWNNSSTATTCQTTHHGFYAEVTSSGMGGMGYSYLCIGAWAASAEL